MEALLDELMALVKTQQKKCRRHGLTEEINEVKSRILKRADLVDGLQALVNKWEDKAGNESSDRALPRDVIIQREQNGVHCGVLSAT